MLANFLKKCDVQAKGKVLVKIKGACSKYNFPRIFDEGYPAFGGMLQPARGSPTPTLPVQLSSCEMDAAHTLQRRATIQRDASNATLRNPNGDLSLTYVAVEIDELADGYYAFEVSFAGGTAIDNVTVMNKYGEEYASYVQLVLPACFIFKLLEITDGPCSVVSPTGSASLLFDIADGSNLPAALIARTTKAVNVTYSGSGTLTANGTTNGAAVSVGFARPLLYALGLWIAAVGWLNL